MSKNDRQQHDSDKAITTGDVERYSESGATNSAALTIKPDVSATNLIDAIHAKWAHIDALTNAIYGGGFEAFNLLDDKSKDEYLWAISDLVKEGRTLFKAYDFMFFSNGPRETESA